MKTLSKFILSIFVALFLLGCSNEYRAEVYELQSPPIGLGGIPVRVSLQPYPDVTKTSAGPPWTLRIVAEAHKEFQISVLSAEIHPDSPILANLISEPFERKADKIGTGAYHVNNNTNIKIKSGFSDGGTLRIRLKLKVVAEGITSIRVFDLNFKARLYRGVTKVNPMLDIT